MKFNFRLLEKAEALQIYTWRYEEEYSTYNFGGELDSFLLELLDRRSPYFAVFDDAHVLVGFFCFGTTAQVGPNLEPHLYDLDNSISIGLAMRPDLTGKGLGYDFVRAGVTFALEKYHPTGLRLFVLPFNQRAIKVYERIGFRQVGNYNQITLQGSREFIEMRYFSA